MTQVQLLTLINKLQLTLSKAKDALENTYLPAYVVLHYIEASTFHKLTTNLVNLLSKLQTKDYSFVCSLLWDEHQSN